MLASAEQAAGWAAQDRPGVIPPEQLMAVAAKAMNRAGGFLEAVIIVMPELGVELLAEFEIFATRIDGLADATKTQGDRRSPGTRGSTDDRRAADRRSRHDRRGEWRPVAIDRRATPDRRAESDRRTGKIRELADRRWRALKIDY
jgi:hypothetical protein